MRFAFIAKTSGFPIAWMCRRLGVSVSGYHAWRARKPSKRVIDDFRAFHRKSRGVYGVPRIYDDLVADGERVSPKRAQRLMREMGLWGRKPKLWKKTTHSDHGHGYSPNHVKQEFTADAPNKLWMADISYVRTWAGWMFLAVIIDAFSRRVVGYAVDDHMRAELALEALQMAVANRNPTPGLVHHSDRGTQYSCAAYTAGLEQIRATSSMSGTGNCHDNAAVESFFSTLKEELIYRHAWPTKEGVVRSVTDYIDNFYTSYRRHSTIGRISRSTMNSNMRGAWLRKKTVH